MKFAHLTLIILFVASSCRQSGASSSKSIVGLESGIKDGSSFQYLQEWFNGELPVSAEMAQFGNIPYKVQAEFSENTMGDLPKDVQDLFYKKFKDYLIQQSQRISDFQSNLKNKSKIEELLAIEVAEMEDIILGLIDVNHVATTKDLLAQLVTTRELRNFMNRYALGFLQKIYKRPQKNLIQKIDLEAKNFKELLLEKYMDDKGANATLIVSLEKDCAKLRAMLVSLKQDTKEITCSAGATGLKLDSAPTSVAASAKTIGGPSGQVLGIFAGITSPDGPVGLGAAAPKLSIYGSRDPNVGTDTGTTSGGGGSSSGTTGGSSSSTGNIKPTTTGGGGGLTTGGGGAGGLSGIVAMIKKLIASLGAGGFNSGYDPNKPNLALNSATINVKNGTDPALIPEPQGLCNDQTGPALVICRQFIETLPTTEQLSGGKPSMTKPNSGGTSSTGLNLGESYRFDLISKYGTSVQNQGSEGACTAYGNAHVLTTLQRKANKNPDVDAQEIWKAQGMTPQMPASINAAASIMKGRGLQMNTNEFDVSVESIKQRLNAGLPVYFGSDVDNSWQGTGTGQIGCSGSKIGAHAYSIMGYDDTNQMFVVKNSWGDMWGDQGYGYLKYECIGKLGWTQGFEHTLTP